MPAGGVAAAEQQTILLRVPRRTSLPLHRSAAWRTDPSGKRSRSVILLPSGWDVLVASSASTLPAMRIQPIEHRLVPLHAVLGFQHPVVLVRETQELRSDILGL